MKRAKSNAWIIVAGLVFLNSCQAMETHTGDMVPPCHLSNVHWLNTGLGLLETNRRVTIKDGVIKAIDPADKQCPFEGYLMTQADRRGIRVAGHLPEGVSIQTASAAGMQSIEHLVDERDFFCNPVDGADCAQVVGSLAGCAVTGPVTGGQGDTPACRK